MREEGKGEAIFETTKDFGYYFLRNVEIIVLVGIWGKLCKSKLGKMGKSKLGKLLLPMYSVYVIDYNYNIYNNK